MKLYIYDNDNEIRAIIDRDTNEDCEVVATELYGDTDAYGWSYADYGLTETVNTEYL